MAIYDITAVRHLDSGDKRYPQQNGSIRIIVTGKITSLREWWSHLIEAGQKCGYYSQPTKSWLIVKQEKLEQARRAFEGTGIQITVEASDISVW